MTEKLIRVAPIFVASVLIHLAIILGCSVIHFIGPVSILSAVVASPRGSIPAGTICNRSFAGFAKAAVNSRRILVFVAAHPEAFHWRWCLVTA